jgi:hypothetical protein
VLVVGSAQSGCQIAEELHESGRDGVTLLGKLRGIQDGHLSLAPDLKENLAKADQFETNTALASPLQMGAPPAARACITLACPGCRGKNPACCWGSAKTRVMLSQKFIPRMCALQKGRMRTK